MECLILTKAQADGLRGKYGKYSELEPIPIKSDEYVLPSDVLNDDAFISVKHILLNLPKRIVAEDEFLNIEET